MNEQAASAGTAEGPGILAVLVDDQLELIHFNGDTAIMPFNASQVGVQTSRHVECFTQRLDKNSKTAAVNAAGSRQGPSWLTF
jgi:hypothetical protein